MPPTTRSSTRFAAEANTGCTSRLTPQVSSASTPSSIKVHDSEDVMKTFTRRFNEEAEKKLDKNVMESFGSEKPKNPISYFKLLATIVEGLKPQPAHKSMVEFINFVEKHPGFVNKLDECWKDRCFTPIRNLAIFRPEPDPEEIGCAPVKELAMCLTVTVHHRKRTDWGEVDLQANNVLIHEEGVTSCAFVQDIIEQLRQPRYYSKASQKEKCAIPTYRIVHENYPDEFEQVFKMHPNGKKGKVAQEQREFMALFQVLHRVSIDIEEGEAADYSSSSLTTILCNNFIHPSAFFPNKHSKTLQYWEGLAWSFSMMVHVSSDDSIYKFKPRSDWHLREKKFGLPLAICEIISDEGAQSDEWRMLIQAVALSRSGNQLLKSEDKLFFMIAIYLDKDFEVRRYIVKPQDRSASAQVHIFRKKFQLKNRAHVILFVKEMLNLSSVGEDLAKDVDPGKMEKLKKVQLHLKEYRSLTTQNGKNTNNTAKKGDHNQGTMGSVEEDPGEGDGSHFQSRNIAVLDRLGLVFGYADFIHPNVALVFKKTKDELAEYLKFIKDGSEELNILNYLAQFDTDYNHAIRPIRFWPVQGGMMVSLPPGGKWITHIEDVSKHLGGLVRQLIEGICFLHECNVAHLDIKPSNLVIPPTYGRLSIIDFNISVYLKGPSDKKLHRRVGSKGYMAPEVGSVPYDPVKADLYSCGVVIKELCELVKSSSERSFFLSIANQLMDNDPNHRPSMKEVLASLTVPYQTFAEKRIESPLIHLPRPIYVE